IFRIFSMTKPVVSVGIMMLLEEGHFLLNDPVAKYIPEFASQEVGVEHNGKLELVPLARPMTIQDLLRPTSGITYDHTGNGLAEPFATDPWNGDKIQLFNMLEKPAMESGGGGLVSTTMDYARFCQMLLNGGALDGMRIIGRKTLQLMASGHLGPHVKIRGDLV